ncbi:uncharacterized protein L201_001619 [Kwoniella dendrophila CBS 6074]|uniref:Spindle assembly checkpoint component MAD1 n=1 Tax=Kwoniella dendrophila CBS 6074 TaxID=1295534 RepID=A0AAX4JMU4_9TREE
MSNSSGSRLPIARPGQFGLSSSTNGTPSSSSFSLRASTSNLGKRGAGEAGLEDLTSMNRQIDSLNYKNQKLERNIRILQTQEQEFESKIEEQRNEIERLKAERRNLHDGEKKERQVGEERERDFYDDRKRYTDEISNLRNTKSNIMNELESLKSEHRIILGKYTSLKSNANSEISLLNSRIIELENQLNQLKSWERRAQSLSIELEEERRKNEEKHEKGQLDNENRRIDDTLQKEVKRQSLNMATIYRENESLKSEVVELRQKRKESEVAERKAKLDEKELKDQIRILQEQLERSRRDMDSLTQTFPASSSSSSSSTPDKTSDETLRVRLSTLSDLHNQATSDLATKDSQYRELHQRFTDLAQNSQITISQFTKRAEEAERELRWAKEGRNSAEKRENLAKMEIERIRVFGSSKSMPGGMISDQSAKVAELESLVELYKSELDSISRDSRETEERIAQGMGLVKSSDLDEAKSKTERLQEDIQSLESTITELTSANTRLDGEVNDLMRRVASGEYNPNVERVLEFKDSPSNRIMAVRTQTLIDLQNENNELLEKLKELDEIISSNSPSSSTSNVQPAEQKREACEQATVPRSSFDRLKKEKEDLEKNHEKRLMRLKEIFGSKSKEFLEAVYSLLGWRIKFDESGLDIKLTSMYAPKGKSGLTLKFVSNEGHFGTMQMSGMMSRGLEESRHFWIVERQSVPGFLAQVTTEMFEKTTIGRAAGYVGLE